MEFKKAKLPRILADYLESTGQLSRGPLSAEHLLNEAEWCLYNAYDNEASGAYEYHPQSKAALRRFVQNLRALGVEPKRDFDD